MPTRELMTWIPEQKRWTKRYCGRRYYVSARQLGIKPETKEASLQAANQWWRDKQAELDTLDQANRNAQRIPTALEDMVAAATNGVPWTSQESIAQAAAAYLAKLPPSTEAETFAERMQDAAYQETEKGEGEAWEQIATALGRLILPKLLEQTVLAGQPLPKEIAERLPPGRVSQIESASKAIRGESATKPERTVQAFMDDWLSNQRALAAIGELSPRRYDCVGVCVRHFASFVGETTDAATINAECLDAFYRYALSRICDKREGNNGGWSAIYAKEVFSNTRRFVRWLWERGIIEMPKNLNSRSFRFGPPSKTIETWSLEEIRKAIGTASGAMKLAILLSLNCGMTQTDVSDLLDVEVNWREGRITRKRSKTRGRKETPTVCYKLWPVTFELLKELRSGREHVLLTKSGRPYVRAELVDGKLVRADDFQSLYTRLSKKLGFKKPMKLLRKTAASKLESHETYGRFTSLFLGHAPTSMKDRHYAAPPQALFDAAVTWLGEEFGFLAGEKEAE